MTYQPVKPPEEDAPTLWRRRNFEDWQRAWKNAKHFQERIGLLHEIYGTTGSDIAFRWLLEAADEFRGLAKKTSKQRDELILIAEAALEQAVRRTLKGCSIWKLAESPEDVSCLFWFMRTEGRSFVNMDRLRLRDPHAGVLWDVVEHICEWALSGDTAHDKFHSYRRDAVFIMAARAKLSSIVPRVMHPKFTLHPWNSFDADVMLALRELALRDAGKLGSDSVEFALVHGSEAAAIYTAAMEAKKWLHAMQGSQV